MIDSSEGLRTLAEALESAHHRGEVDFAAFLAATPPATELDLAGLIEHDGYLLRSKGASATLDRYLSASPDLASKRTALDAALEATLLSMVEVSGHSLDDAMGILSGDYPQLAQAIRSSGALTATLSVTRLARLASRRPADRPLPCDFGPLEPDGSHRYELLERVGEGASSLVYRARDRRFSDEATEALVAVKILSSADRSAVRRVRAEALASRSVAHDGVVAPIDHGVTDGGEPFLISPWIRGRTLDLWLEDGPDHASIVSLFVELAEALHAAHESRVLHLDLHLRNVIVDRDDHPHLVDFGLARREAVDDHDPDSPLGALGFISPEQYRMSSHHVSARSDVYALGGMLHYALVGELPNGSTRDEARRRLEDRSLPPVGPRDVAGRINVDLDRVCRRALAPRPEDRTPSAQHLADDLRLVLGRRTLPWARTPATRRMYLAVRRRPVVVGLGLVSSIALVGVIIAVTFSISLLTVRRDTVREFRQELLRQVEEAETETELMAHLGVLEALAWLEGVYATPEGRPLLAPEADRLAVVGRRVEIGYEQNDRADLNLLIWELALIHMVLGDRPERPETAAMLARNRAGWEAIGVLSASGVEDYLDTLDAAWHVKRESYEADRRKKPGGPGYAKDVEALRGAERVLLAALGPDARWDGSSPMVQVVHRALHALYAPRLLDEPELRRRYRPGEAAR